MVRVCRPDRSEVIGWALVEDALDVPVGGPYRVEERADDGTVVSLLEELFVGDLFLLAGQSNMLGCGQLQGLEPPRPLVRMFGMDHRWQPAIEPLHRPWRSPDPVHRYGWTHLDPDLVDADVAASVDTPNAKQGAGAGVAFGNEYAHITGVPVALLPAAFGGTTLADWAPDNPGTRADWRTDTPGAPGTSLFSSMMRITQAAGGRIAGLLWHQGESDAMRASSAQEFVDGTRTVFDALRKELAQPDLPVYLAQMAFFPVQREPGAAERWTTIRLAQGDPGPLGAQGVVATNDLTLADPVHLDTRSQQRLGRRFARLAGGRARTMRLEEVSARGRLAAWPMESLETYQVRLRFSGVTGRLVSPFPSGFSLRAPNGTLLPGVFRVDLDGDCAIVHLAGARVEGAALHYGYGVVGEVPCTITDEADMALPALGPIALPAED
jgi:sialate O-acetylesterase